jgi:hypothetical protein
MEQAEGISWLFIGFFVNPFYEMVAREGDVRRV